MTDKYKEILKQIEDSSKKLKRQINIMEVCGTHTVNFARSGLKKKLPDKVECISGPGCPVCVTPMFYFDNACWLAANNIGIITFGDLIKVPGSRTSLYEMQAEGKDIKVIYSPEQCMEIALKNKNKEFVFLSVGFETTIPLIAEVILETKKRKIKNLSFYTSNFSVIPALKALITLNDLKIDGFILPGHVSAIIGEEIYDFLEKKQYPCVITGFDGYDIIRTINLILKKIITKDYKVENIYKAVVKRKGNILAQKIMNKVFRPSKGIIRGLGEIRDVEMVLKKDYIEYDAGKKYNLKKGKAIENKNCRCAEVICGKIKPFKCSMFGKTCTPENPLGPCMVSTEGSCAAYYKYY